MRIDLQNDSKMIRDYINSRVSEYPEYINLGPGEDEDPISLITAGFEIAQSGWVALVFDTRPNGSPDGTWQSYIAENQIEFPTWLEALDRLWDHGEQIEFKLPTGKVIELRENEEPAAVIGGVLKDILLELRQVGGFADLPIADNCCMCVEDHDGAFGWPEYEKQHDEGRVA